MSLTSDLNPSPRRVELHYHIHHKWMCDRTGTPQYSFSGDFMTARCKKDCLELKTIYSISMYEKKPDTREGGGGEYNTSLVYFFLSF